LTALNPDEKKQWRNWEVSTESGKTITAAIQSRIESEVISPTAMAGGNAGLVLCQVGGQYSGQ
jgi:hypothetical protein